jgi:hypothetical protein
MLAPALLLLVAAQSSPVVGLVAQPAVGLSPDEATALFARVQRELQALGLSVVEAPAVDPSCVQDAACVEQTRAAATSPLDALLVVELLRVGPVVQVSATGAGGEQHATGSVSLDEGQLKAGSVLPPAIAEWAKALAPPPPKVPPPTTTPTPTEAPFELTAMKSGALFAGGLGVVALGAGVLLVATSEPVLEDASSLGKEKEQARTLGLIGLGATVLGVAGAGSAVGLWLVE